MAYKNILQPRARRELPDAWIWYEERQVGSGDRFENEVYKRLHSLKSKQVLGDTNQGME